LNCLQEVGVDPRQNKLLGQARANSRVETIVEAGYFVDVVLTLATSLIEGTLKLGDIDRQGVIALLEGI